MCRLRRENVRRISSDGGAFAFEEDSEEKGQEVQATPERPKNLRQGYFTGFHPSLVHSALEQRNGYCYSFGCWYCLPRDLSLSIHLSSIVLVSPDVEANLLDSWYCLCLYLFLFDNAFVWIS
ncbi:unnamed protein product [Coffea canephora]|uniref:Uncharacterized protein n=1 Tax=Coffea canephora TaxID=49390 RepID=A0A068U3P0_COFCA|nr:unnamed protein product [Coffea canephora]